MLELPASVLPSPPIAWPCSAVVAGDPAKRGSERGGGTLCRWVASTAAGLLTLVAGCGSAEPRLVPVDGRGEPDTEAAVRRWVSEQRLPGPARRWLRRSTKTRVLAPNAVPPSTPVGVQRRIDVSFRDADLDNALRFLADVGRFSLVTDGEISGRIDLVLRAVLPYDAMVAVAEAHGAVVSQRGPVVVVSAR